MSALEGKRLRINGISLYYQVHGQGDPLLLMHGGGVSADCFNAMLPGLTGHFQIITPDSRAQGRSTDSGEPLSYKLMSLDMIGLLDVLGIDSAYVGGWSDGASIAIHMAIHYPERVKALVLTPVDLSAEALTDRFWKDAETHKWEFPECLVTWWNNRKSPLDDELSRIDIPTLIIAGENEQYVKHDYFIMWNEVIPNSELAWITETDHFLIYEKPNQVNEAILSFLSRL